MKWGVVNSYRSPSASQVAFSCPSDSEGSSLGFQLDLVSLGACHEVSEHSHPLLPGRHVCSGCSQFVFLLDALLCSLGEGDWSCPGGLEAVH